VGRLRREARLLQSIDDPRVIRFYALEPYRNGVALVLEHFEGAPLAQTVPVPGDGCLDRFFPIAIQCAEVLIAVHDRHLVHKDVNPSNLLWNARTGALKLIDFGISEDLSVETQAASGMNQLEGTLAYIAPEQTGRIDRAVDHRSDYYSLGITLYEYLTGSKPFDADSVMGWVHCHITKAIPIDRSRFPEVPAEVFQILAKLTAKNMDERYQSAFGLKHDLELALLRWRSGDCTSDFRLGSQDTPSCFQIPEKLYGRQAPLQALLECFEAATKAAAPLVLLHGAAGVGKSALMGELRRAVHARGGIFLEGRCDPFQRDTPYYGIAQAFSRLAAHLLAEPQGRLDAWKERLGSALGRNGQVVMDLVPEMAAVLGEQPPLAVLPAAEAKNRFLMVLRDFVATFANAASPLVLFVDDLHWADASSFALLESLAAGKCTPSLLLVGTYRDGEGFENPALARTVAQLAERDAVVHIGLLPLSREDVGQLLVEMLHSHLEHVDALSRVIFEKTHGTPFFIVELLTRLWRERALAFSFARGRWEWDLGAIEGIALSANVLDVLIQKLARLPARTQDLLKLASCLDDEFDLALLAALEGSSLEDAARELGPAMRAQLLSRDEPARDADGAASSPANARCQFSHHRIRAAASSLLSVAERQHVHLRIGRLLRDAGVHTRSDPVALVRHFNHSLELIRDESERSDVATLNLAAARRAYGSSAHQLALQYALSGLSCVGESSWRGTPELVAGLHDMASEAAFVIGDSETSERHLGVLIEHATEPLERAKLFHTQSRRCWQRGRTREGGERAMAALAMLEIEGVGLEFDISAQRLRREHDILLQLIERVDVRALDRHPIVERADIALAIEIVTLSLPLFLGSGQLNTGALGVVLGVKLCLAHGVTSVAAITFVWYAVMLDSVLEGDLELAFQFGSLGHRVSERLGESKSKAFELFSYALFVRARYHHPSTVVAFMQAALDAAYQSGDMNLVADASINMTIWTRDSNLELALTEGEKYLQIIRSTNNIKVAWHSAKRAQQFRRNLCGLTRGRFSLSDDTYDEEALAQDWIAEGRQGVLAGYYLFRMQLHYIYGDYRGARDYLLEVAPIVDVLAGQPWLSEFQIYGFLVASSAIGDEAADTRPALEEIMARTYARQSKCALHRPVNFLHHVQLMDAEKARLSGDFVRALRGYDQAITHCHEHGYIRYEAHANERAAELLMGAGLERLGYVYAARAFDCYEGWGASAKCQQLPERFPELGAKARPSRKRGSEAGTGVEAATGHLDSSDLDLDTVMKAALTLSGEVRLDQLLRKLMALIQENTASERAYLLLLEDAGELSLQGRIAGDQVEVMQGGSLEQLPLALGVVQYVRRTNQAVVLGDAARKGAFVNDPTVIEQQAKSLLCLPILTQGRLVGVLYLENNTTPHIFTEARLRTIGVLASQAAISIENAKLYREQERKVEARTAELRAKTRHMQGILENVPQGILNVVFDNVIHEEYAKYLETILGRGKLAGLDFVSTVLEGSNLSDEAKSMVDSCLRLSMGGDPLFFDANAHVLCSEFERAQPGAAPMVVAVDWHPITDAEGLVDRIMVTLRDVTQLRLSQAEARVRGRELAIVGQIIAVEPAALHEFVGESLAAMDRCRRLLQAASEQDGIISKDVLRELHTIKGNARTYRFSILTTCVHDVEQRYAELSRTDEAAWDPLACDRELGKVVDVIREYERIDAEKLCRRSASTASAAEPPRVADLPRLRGWVRELAADDLSREQRIILERIERELQRADAAPLPALLDRILDSLPSLAEQLGKRPPHAVLEHRGIAVGGDGKAIVRDVFTHLVRNSLAHGIETAEARVESGKLPQGTIRLAVALAGEWCQLTYGDDGAGLDLLAIRDRAVQSGLLRADEPWRPEEVARSILAGGVSTAREVNEISGRGVGMSAVREMIEAHGGSVALSLLDADPALSRRPFEVHMTLPAGYFVWLDPAEGPGSSERVTPEPRPTRRPHRSALPPEMDSAAKAR
jgi:predicted ATPase/GAF domain-containing protein